MNIINYVKSLANKFFKDDSLDRIIKLESILDNNVILPFNTADKFFKSKFSSDVTLSLFKDFSKYSKIKVKPENVINYISSSLPNISNNLKFIEKIFNDELDEIIISDGLTTKKAAILQAVDHIFFITNYSIDFLSYIYHLEAIANGGEVDIDRPTKSKEKDIKENLANYVILLNNYSMKETDFQENFNTITDLNVGDPNLQTVTEALPVLFYTAAKVALFVGLPVLLPRFMGWVAMRTAEFQSYKYNSWVINKEQLELKLLRLKALRDGSVDANLEKKIEYNQQRLDELEYKINKMLEKVYG